MAITAEQFTAQRHPVRGPPEPGLRTVSGEDVATAADLDEGVPLDA